MKDVQIFMIIYDLKIISRGLHLDNPQIFNIWMFILS